MTDSPGDERINAVAAFRVVKDSVNTAYVLSNDLRIVRTNAGWTQFAAANGGEALLRRWGRGSAFLDAIPEELRALFLAGFAQMRATGEPWEFDYDCSSPETFREFRMIAFPLAGDFFIVTHSPRINRPHDREGMVADDECYTDAGVIRMCVYCRRVRAVGEVARWDWVPAYVKEMPANVSHGLCPSCAVFHAPP